MAHHTMALKPEQKKQVDFYFNGTPYELKTDLGKLNFGFQSRAGSEEIYGIKGTTATLHVLHENEKLRITGTVPIERYKRLSDMFGLSE